MRQRTINTKTKLATAAEKIAASAKRKKAVDLLVPHFLDPDKVPEPRITEIGLFTEDDLRAIRMVAMKQAKYPFVERLFVEQMDATTPVTAKACVDDAALDFWRAISQPEICEELWPNWNSRTGGRGPHPGYMTKAVMMMLATVGRSPHINDNYDLLSGHEGIGWRAIFDWLEQTGAAATGRQPVPFGAKVYGNVCSQIIKVNDPRLNPGALTIDRCHTINRELWRWLQKQFPGFGLRLGIDGLYFPGWLKQGGLSEEDWERIRVVAPNASVKTIEGRGTVNGYNLVVLCDLATGVPLVWRLLPAGSGENSTAYESLMLLLSDLFTIDPEFPTEAIVADQAWNGADCVRDCAVNYGIHLLSGLSVSTRNRKVRKFPFEAHDALAGYDGYGHVYCKQHGTIMRRSSSEFFDRAKRAAVGLKPGEPVPWIDTNFRHRLKCEHGGGPCDSKPTVPMSLDWNSFAYYPHTIDAGRERDQAFRIAMYSRRNTCEAIFGALKLGHKLGNNGAARTHTSWEYTVETLLSLGLLMRTAAVTANERILRGEMPEDPPPDLAERLR